MRFLFNILLFFVVPIFTKAQPLITTGGGAGLGEYGYLEKEAYTYATLHRNNYNNIDYLSARFWVTDNVSGNGNGTEYVYNTYSGQDGNWNCDDAIYYKRTSNYSPSNFGSEWTAGSDVYVSVFAKYCPVASGPWVPSAPNGSTVGYNEKHFQVIDITNLPHPSVVANVPDGNGDCTSKVVGSFVINPGSISGLSLTRLKLQNIGNSQETNDIPIDGLKLYYEPSTGSEVFDGNESTPANNTIWGNWNSDSQFNNFYEAGNLSVPINGATRIYITLCDLASTYVKDRQVLMYITNDGISISPNQSSNGSDALRINFTNITNVNVVLPHNDLVFSGFPYKNENKIDLNIKNLLSDTKKVVIERSTDIYDWEVVSTYNAGDGLAGLVSFWDRDLKKESYYYRTVFINSSGFKTYSYLIQINNRFIKPLSNDYRLINTLSGEVFLIYNRKNNNQIKISVFNTNGAIISSTTGKAAFNQRIPIVLPGNVSRGLYIVSVTDMSGNVYAYKFIH
ncbi:MAG: T9SS type A sorting domain-containing protein [Sphingobacteriales bacterium]|nr:T9SS type A sorting domain-containing protein [Sphingobacteriales bacterium]